MSFLSGLLSMVTKSSSKYSSKNNGISSSSDYDNYKVGKNPYSINSEDTGTINYTDDEEFTKIKDTSDGKTTFREINPFQHMVDVPKWGYKDFINERVSWLKGLDSAYGEPAFFYFKIFFKFDTNYGLLGGIIKDTDGKSWKEQNTANRFLTLNSGLYKQENLAGRRIALEKFVKSLSWISSKAPWFFNSVKDANLGMAMHFENLTQKKTLEIECLEEAIDMRLNTLFDLYKYACYDNINMKEIIPENLRKFDMDIVVFQAPLRYYQTSVRDLKNRSAYYKNMYDQDMNNRFTFKLFSFINCEFDYESLNTLLPSEFTNGSPFQSKPAFKINYDRVYTHTQNEYFQLLVGDTGLLWDGAPTKPSSDGNNSDNDTEDTSSNKADPHILIHQYANDHSNYHNSSSQIYKAMVDATESTIGSAMMLLDGQATLGNLYYNKSVGDTFKDTFKSIGNTYKNSAMNVWKSVTKW